MRHVRHEIFLEPVEFVQPAGHGVEVARQVGKLVVARGVEPVEEFPLGDGPRPLGQVSERPGDRAVDQERDQGADDEDDQGGDPEHEGRRLPHGARLPDLVAHGVEVGQVYRVRLRLQQFQFRLQRLGEGGRRRVREVQVEVVAELLPPRRQARDLPPLRTRLPLQFGQVAFEFVPVLPERPEVVGVGQGEGLARVLLNQVQVAQRLQRHQRVAEADAGKGPVDRLHPADGDHLVPHQDGEKEKEQDVSQADARRDLHGSVAGRVT